MHVDQFQQQGYVPVYYWSHGVIALDWFRYAEQDPVLKFDPARITHDFLIYNRTYDTKNFKFIKFLINNLNNKKIHIIGEVFNNKKLVNHGLISRDKSLQLLSRAKFTILPEDNLYSLFFLDAAISNVNIFCSSKFKINKNYFINLKIKKIDFK